MASTHTHHPIPALSKMTLDDVPAHHVADGTTDHPDKPREQIINPFEVVAADEYGVDYDKLIVTFGTRRIDESTLERFERLTGRKPHRYLRRGHFFSQR